MTRIDKFLWFVRLTKTRSIATQICKSGKVQLDDREVKPSADVKLRQVISIKKNAAVFQYKVLQLLDKRVSAKLIDQFVKNITSESELEKFQLYQLAQKEYRNSGFGKPTTRDRRHLRKLKGK